jgi:hypothetical protein
MMHELQIGRVAAIARRSPRVAPATKNNLLTRILSVMAMLTAVLAFSIPALGQGTSQSGLVGTVTDATGAVIPGATVHLINTQTNAERTATTSGSGDYSMTNLQPANYKMRIDKDGFKAATVAPFDLQVGKIQNESLVLEIGSSSESVEVSTTAAQLQTADATVGQVIDQKQVNDLPLNGRGVLQLATLSAGVSPQQTATTGNPAGQTGTRNNYITVDGGRPTSTNYIVDGVYARNLRFNTLAFQPNVDTIQEFNLLRNGFSTEFGQGQSVVSMVTKSGTNQIHGSAYIFTRSQIFDARPYASTYASTPKKPVFHRNQYGATVGGPIIKNRVFGFFGFEGLRTAKAGTSTGNFPTQNLLAGATSPLAIALSPTIPVVQSTANCAGCNNGVDYAITTKFVDNYDEYTGRADQVLSPKHTIFERYIKYDASQFVPAVNTATSYPATAQNLAIGDTYLITPTLVNEFRIGLQRAIGYIVPVNFGTGNTNWVAQAGLINLQGGVQPSEFGRPGVTLNQNLTYTSDPAKLNPTDGSKPGNPYPTGPTILCPADPVKLAASSYSVNPYAANCAAWSSIGEGGLSQGTTETNYGVSEVLSDVIGRHTIRTGVQYQYRPVIALADNGARGSLTFVNLQNYNDVNGQYVSASGEFGSSLGHYTDQTIGVFINDVWQIAPRLTANVGIRWEYVSPFVEKDGLEGSLDPKTGLIGFNKVPKNIPAIVLPNLNLTPGVFGPGIIQPDKNNFGPRLGLAYQFSKTATIRTGFGVFFDNTNLNELQFTRAIPPFYIANNLTGGGPQKGLFPSNPVLSPAPFSVFADNRTPYSYEWNLSLQQELGHNLLFELAYTGSSTHKLSKRFDWNEDVFSGIGPTAIDLGRPWTRFQHGILTSANKGAANFHGLATRLEQRQNNGLSYLLSFQWSKNLDNAAGEADSNSTSYSNNFNFDHSYSNFDTPLRAVASVSYELPFGKGKRWLQNKYADVAVGGWQLQTITQLRTGYPFQVQTTNPAGTTFGSYTPLRPILKPGRTGGKVSNPNRGHYFDSTAYDTPPTGFQGTVTRNTLRGPGTQNVDLSAIKNFSIEGPLKAQFRAEAFNLLNHVNLANPNANITSSTVGQITGTSTDQRDIQLAFKLLW